VLSEGYDAEFELGQEVDLVKTLQASPATNGVGGNITVLMELPDTLTEFVEEFSWDEKPENVASKSAALDRSSGANSAGSSTFEDQVDDDVDMLDDDAGDGAAMEAEAVKDTVTIKTRKMQEEIKATLWLEAEYSNAEFAQAFQKLTEHYTDTELHLAFDQLRQQGIVTKSKSRPGRWRKFCFSELYRRELRGSWQVFALC
jgi:hypothetical protein